MPALRQRCPSPTIAFLGDESFPLQPSLFGFAPRRNARSSFLLLIPDARVPFDWASLAQPSSYSAPWHNYSRKYARTPLSAITAGDVKTTPVPPHFLAHKILSAEPFSPFSSAAPQDASPTAGLHSRAESVSPFALKITGLKSAFHRTRLIEHYPKKWQC